MFVCFDLLHQVREKSDSKMIIVSSFSVAGDMSEPGVYSGEEESDLLSPHQWREDSGG